MVIEPVDAIYKVERKRLNSDVYKDIKDTEKDV